MIDWLVSPTFLWLIVIGMAVEGILIGVFNRRTGRGIPFRKALPNQLAGCALMAALALALNHTASVNRFGIGGLLIVALIAHLFDLRARWNAAETREG